jgi:hypothetical protein
MYAGRFFVWTVANSHLGMERDMAKKATKLRPWSKEDIRMMKTLAREKTKTSVIARKLKRSVQATYQKAMRLGVTLGASRKKRLFAENSG